MDYKQIASRITGVSCPFFGLSWNPPQADRDIAQRVITFLEDRRVLYNPYELEVPEFCIDSVVSIREFLTQTLMETQDKKELSDNLRAMRAACRKFMNEVPDARNVRSHHMYPDGPSSWEFLTALGDLRTSLGFRVGVLAVMYGLDVEGDLLKILPPRPDEEESA
jgi:hypothetical protein